MTEQGALLTWMIEKEIEKLKAKSISISNHLYDTPKTIKLEADEIAFISFVKIEANTTFTFNYSSTTEKRIIEKTIITATTIENNIITKHLSSISFKMSNTDKSRENILGKNVIKTVKIKT